MKSLVNKSMFGLFIYFICTLAFASGLKLEFQINEDFLICHTFSKKMNRSASRSVMEIRDNLKKLFPEKLLFLQQLEDLSPAIIQREYSRLEPLLTKAKSLPVYHELLLETEKHLNEVKNEWQTNYAKSFDFMTSQTRIKFDKEIKVFITHPEVFQGRFLGGNSIAWGRRSDWKNYSTVYLWHEILHTYLQLNDRTHALIELMTDDALRVYLNGGSYPPFTKDGHKELVEIKTWIFANYWSEYLSNTDKDIFQLEKELLSAVNYPLSS